MITETIFPNAERAIRKLRARTDLPEPNTEAKNREAASWLDSLRVCLGTRFVLVGRFKRVLEKTTD